MSNNKEKKKRPFNIYWIYALIGIAAIGINLFMGSNTSVKVKSESFFALADSSYVEEVKLVNRQRVDFKVSEAGREFIAANPEKFAKLKTALEAQNKASKSAQPVFQFDVADAGNFANNLDKVNEKLKASDKKTVPLEPVEEVNYLGSIISFLLPILILVLIWVFIMRRMSGGAGGGDRKSVV